MSADVEHGQHGEDPDLHLERDPQAPSMLDVLATIKPVDILPKTIYEPDFVVGRDIELAERSDLSSAQGNLDRVASNVFDVMTGIKDGTATDDEYSPILGTQHPGREDMSALVNGVIQGKIMDTFVKTGLISTTYNGPEIKRSDVPGGRYTEVVQYRRTELDPVRSKDGQRVYDWMERVSTREGVPDQLVLLRRGSIPDSRATAQNGRNAR